MVKLGVNIDHIATLRQARRIGVPDVITAANIAELADADGITVHLREDRRHIQEQDVYLLRQVVKTKLNLEMSLNEEIVKIALAVKPDEVCIVPERREEITTEGGLNIESNRSRLEEVIQRLKDRGILVSLFIDPEISQVQLAKLVKADCVELHTGKYAIVKECEKELVKLQEAAKETIRLGMILNAGHGLDYKNVVPVARIQGMNTLNIGFSIISRAIFVGLYQAVKEMKELITSASAPR